MLNKLKHLINLKIGHALSSPLITGAVKKLYPYHVRSNGLKFFIKDPLINESIISSIFWGYYERTERKAVERYLKKGLPIVELGSSIGYITLNIHKKSPDQKIIAVEGNPHLIPLIEENVKINKAHNIKVLNAVISYSGEEREKFTIDEGNLGSQLNILSGGNSASFVYVDSVTLKTIIQDNNITGPYVLVSDIEGAEFFLLKNENDDKVINNCVQLIIELHDLVDGEIHVRKEDLVEIICNKWKLAPVDRRNNVWVFEKQS